MRTITLMISIFLFVNAFSQKVIEVYHEKNAQGNYQFYCINHDYCPYIVEIKFSELTNLKAEAGFADKIEVQPGRNSLFALSPININEGPRFNYSYNYIKGCINPKVKPSLAYLLPVAPGKETSVFELKFFSLNDNDPKPKDYYALGFRMKLGDTVYAARRGVITSLSDTVKLKLSGYTMSNKDNFIEVLHDDCTFGRYQVFSKIFVQLGQRIEAGDPIGLAGGEKYTSGPHVRFQVYYNYEQKLETKSKDGSPTILYWAYVPMVFYTQEKKTARLTVGETYTSVHPDSIITQEMSKRQLKQWSKNKSKNHVNAPITQVTKDTLKLIKDTLSERKVNPLQGLIKTGQVELEFGKSMISSSPKTPVYSESLSLLQGDELRKALNSGDFIIVPYIDENRKVRAFALQKATTQDAIQQIQEVRQRDNDPIGKEAPKLTTTDIFGKNYSLEELKGKVVVINFWFIECKPCVTEMAELNKLVDKYKDKEVVFLGFSMNDKSRIEDFLKTKTYKYNIIADSRAIAGLFNVRAYPTHLIIDKNSIISYFFTGLGTTTLTDLDVKIESLLK